MHRKYFILHPMRTHRLLCDVPLCSAFPTRCATRYSPLKCHAFVVVTVSIYHFFPILSPYPSSAMVQDATPSELVNGPRKRILTEKAKDAALTHSTKRVRPTPAVPPSKESKLAHRVFSTCKGLILFCACSNFTIQYRY